MQLRIARKFWAHLSHGEGWFSFLTTMGISFMVTLGLLRLVLG